jgi:hypothetical protein
MEYRHIREDLFCHRTASDVIGLEERHKINRKDAVLECPQSGIRGRENIRLSRIAEPNLKRFAIRHITGTGDLWVTEYVLAYDGRPSYTASIMEFVGREVVRETQYLTDAFEPGASRAVGRADVAAEPPAVPGRKAP